MLFKDFGLSSELLRAINELGYKDPTPIQAQAIPCILEGGDLLAGAQTGTGKTAGFSLPLLQNLTKDKNRGKKEIRALILTPTRELAMQVEESVRALGKYLAIKSMAVFGGVNIKTQFAALNKGIDILVATPGRLLDLLGQKMVSLQQVEMLVLDEADRMLDMGFIHDIRKILNFLPPKRQSLLFSATFSREIKRLAQDLLRDPKLIEVTPVNTTAESISQVIHPVDSKRKKELLSFLISSQNWQQVLVFARTKHGANRLSAQLTEEGINAAAIHGNKSQAARTKALDDFKKGRIRVLVATDIAARGLDIDQLPHVVNFDLPNVPEDYVHRIGRTGRAGNKGQAVSLVCVDEQGLLHSIEKMLKRKIEQVVLPSFEPDPSIKPEPLMNGRRQSSARGYHSPHPQRPTASPSNRFKVGYAFRKQAIK